MVIIIINFIIKIFEFIIINNKVDLVVIKSGKDFTEMIWVIKLSIDISIIIKNINIDIHYF